MDRLDQKPDLTKQGSSLVRKVLGDPSLYPDEFKTWLPRFLGNNINLLIQATQLPQPDTNKLVGGAGNATFTGAWVNFGGSNEPALYYIDPWRRVYLGGIVKSGVIGTSIFTLPQGYRPQYAVIFPVASNDAFGLCTVNPDGTVVANVGSNVYFSLSGITFRQFA